MAQDDLFLREHLVGMILENQELIARYEALAVATDDNEYQGVYYERAAELLRRVTEELLSGYRAMFPDSDIEAILHERRREQEN